MIRRVLLVSLLLVACDPNKSETVTEPTVQTVKPKTTLKAFQPPPMREATPAKVLDLRLKENVGSVEVNGVQQTLVGVGLNLCQTGYYLQGFTRTDAGKLEAAPGLLISRATIPKETTEYRDPRSETKKVTLEFEQFSLDRIVGSLAVSETAADQKAAPLLIYRLDGVPTTAGNAPGLGTQGCFSTGEFSATADGVEVSGPVTAVFDGNMFYLVIAQLTDRHQIMFHIDLRPHQRKAGSLIRGDLARLMENPQKFPFRVTFVTRRDDEAATPPLTADEVPAEIGTVTAAWQTDEAEGPVKIEIADLKLPAWDGPWAGEVVTIKMVASFVTDTRGIRVPRPALLP